MKAYSIVPLFLQRDATAYTRYYKSCHELYSDVGDDCDKYTREHQTALDESECIGVVRYTTILEMFAGLAEHLRLYGKGQYVFLRNAHITDLHELLDYWEDNCIFYTDLLNPETLCDEHRHMLYNPLRGNSRITLRDSTFASLSKAINVGTLPNPTAPLEPPFRKKWAS